MKVYTGRGDKGTSELGDHSCLDKNNLRFRVLGVIDELNSWLGLIRASMDDKKLEKVLQTRQKDLFEVSSQLANAKSPTSSPPLAGLRRASAKKFSLRKVRRLEKEIDLWQKELPRLKKFIYPGGHQVAAFLHLSRTVCRRAEQELVSLDKEEKINQKILIYFNRLSDWLFVLARKVNQEKGIKEETWKAVR
jgi:cob(I)alamin adenosyltransferase